LCWRRWGGLPEHRSLRTLADRRSNRENTARQSGASGIASIRLPLAISDVPVSGEV